jgi:5-deoxy-glucuronate isomerase
MNRHIPHRTTAQGEFALSLAPEQAGWGYSGLRILALDAGRSLAFDTGDDELLVLPLAGGGTVHLDDNEFRLDGRDDVFSAVTDFAYIPRDTRVEITSERGGRFALPSARASRRLTPRYVAAADVAVELRGAGQASRQVNNYCSPEALDADRLIAVEVLTPGGNWSSYPPHKHDEAVPGQEIPLEEIYYFEVADGPGGPGIGYQRAYGSEAGREIDVCAEVRSGDMVLMPHGYHGPSMAAPGYDLYYLNVMAGPAERRWLFSDDPNHGWIRHTWTHQEIDPRLPLTGPRTTEQASTR